MIGLVGGPLLVGGLEPGPPTPPPLNPALQFTNMTDRQTPNDSNDRAYG